MGCDSQYDGYYDAEDEARAQEKKAIRAKVRKFLHSTNEVLVDQFIEAVRAIQYER